MGHLLVKDHSVHLSSDKRICPNAQVLKLRVFDFECFFAKSLVASYARPRSARHNQEAFPQFLHFIERNVYIDSKYLN